MIEQYISQRIVPLLAYINLSLILILLFFPFRVIFKKLKRINKKYFLIVSIILIIGIVIRLYLAPHHHRFFIDESFYMGAAKNILYYFKSVTSDGIYAKQIGWPLVGMSWAVNPISLSIDLSNSAQSRIPMFWAAILGCLTSSCNSLTNLDLFCLIYRKTGSIVISIPAPHHSSSTDLVVVVWVYCHQMGLVLLLCLSPSDRLVTSMEHNTLKTWLENRWSN